MKCKNPYCGEKFPDVHRESPAYNIAGRHRRCAHHLYTTGQERPCKWWNIYHQSESAYSKQSVDGYEERTRRGIDCRRSEERVQDARIAAMMPKK